MLAPLACLELLACARDLQQGSSATARQPMPVLMHLFTAIALTCFHQEECFLVRNVSAEAVCAIVHLYRALGCMKPAVSGTTAQFSLAAWLLKS